MNRNYITRVAPSPTGPIHIGTVSILCYCWYNSRLGGKLYLRIDDTDTERSKLSYKKDIFFIFYSMGIKYDKVIQQSDRYETYEKYKNLISLEKVEAGVYKFKTSEQENIEFKDLNYGKLSRKVSSIHFPICFNKEKFFYSYCSIVDDLELGVNLIIRGADLIDSTFTQKFVFDTLGNKVDFLHLPLMLDPHTNKKISKRNNDPKFSFKYLIGKYLPDVIKLYLLHPDISTKQELNPNMLELLPKPQRSNWKYDIDKLHKIQQKYIKNISAEDIINEMEKHYFIKIEYFSLQIIDVWKVRCCTLDNLYEKLKYYNLHYYHLLEKYQYNINIVNDLTDKYEAKALSNREYRLYTAYRKYFAGSINSPTLKDLIQIFNI